MPDERASGFILYRNHSTGRLYLIIKNRLGGHWGFPKGRLEPNEDEMAAALREVEEEVGIRRPRVLTGFRDRLAYRFVRDRQLVDKEVTLFLAESDEPGVPCGDELEAMEWLPLAGALDRMSYPEQRAVLLRAEAFVEAERPRRGS